MADFNSRYTGAQIEEGIAKTEVITINTKIWAGTPTKNGVAISTMPINDLTGDRTGTYDIVYSDTTTDVRSASGTPNVSRIYIGHEGQHCAGTNTGYSNGTTTFLSSAQLLGGNFIAQHFESNGTGVDDWYIHEIWRTQSA